MKKKVHIALVGGQTMPVILGIKESFPDKVILVHSEKSASEAKHIENLCSEECNLQEFPPVDYDAIKVSVNKLLHKLTDDEITINLSGGTKPWALSFALQTQGMKNVTLLYIDQNSICYNYTQQEKWACKGLNMEELMQYNGQLAKSHILLDDYTEDDLDTLQAIKAIRQYNFNDFNRLTIPGKDGQKKIKNQSKGTFHTSNGSYIEWDKKENYITLSLNGKYGFKENTFESPHIMQIIFNSGWFEYEVAQMVSKWKYAKEIWLNTIYPYNNKYPKNEIDIIVNTGYKLIMIECKTQIYDNTDIDKFNTAVKNYGGLGSKALFITDAKMKPEAIEKCSDNHILSFSMKDFENRQSAQESLFQLLDKELFYINTK